MRTDLLVLSVGLSLFWGSACRSRQPDPEYKPDYRLTATIKDIMDSMVDPIADVVWGAVATIVTPAGIDERTPKTDEEWANVRHAAVILTEATNLLQMPGRRVARPGEKSEHPGIELGPEEIEALVSKDRQTWSKLANGLHAASTEALKAIDAKDAPGLSEAGEKIDEACESCHLTYWYPGELERAKKKQ